VKVRTAKTQTGREFTLYPLSDVHWPQHDFTKLDQWRETVVRDKTALVTLGGDLFDFARGKYRAHLSSFTADDNSRLPVDDMAYSWIEDFAHYLKPIKDKIVMVCVGNHFWRFANGRVSDQELAIQLGRKDAFVGALGLARIKMHRVNPIIALHHDAGRRGGTASADMLAFQHWSHACAADIYCAGHTHRQYAGIFQTRITVNDNEDKIGDKKLVFVRSGAFLKGYSDSVMNPESPFIPDYAEVAMLPPSVMGIISVRVEASATGKLYYTLQQRTI
jgi:hypothetical protein